MNIKTAFALLALTLFAVGCSTMKVTSERDKTYDFGTVKTFQWIDGPADVLDEEDTYINEDIQQALTTELGKLGMQEASDTTKADMQIAYYVKLKEELEYTDPANSDERQFSGGLVYNRGSKSWNYEEREPDLNVYAVEIGTLTVLAYDAESGERIWRGNLRTKLDRSKPEEQQQALIDAAAEKLMGRFPTMSN